jgi:D-alanyl-lipoteichoic acid acyltransferase DltB (MBOAT superfamily)
VLFNSPVFILFFVCVFALYWALRARVPQNFLILAASYVFYGAWSWKFLALLIASTLIDYACGRLIAAAGSQRSRRLIMVASVSANLAFLAAFKYLGFFVREAAELLTALGFQANLPVLQIVLPVGISFYTFQTIGYVVDVYRGKVPAERSLLNYALFVAFFPQLVAGPIERAANMLPQFARERAFWWPAFESGLQLAVWGLFKKIVIADNLAPYVNEVYARPDAYAGGALTAATVFFAFQIYCDFSGYTDTARGVARMLGFELMRNFDNPYSSRTPVEFWRRWHMSLSQWFQDYLYFPLAMHYMRKGGWASKYRAHIVSMTLIGFWHGANWTFVVFGLYWGIVIALYLYSAERLTGDGHAARALGAMRALPAAARAALGVVGMFLVVCVGWVFFRAQSLGDAWYVLTHALSGTGATTVLRVDVPREAVLWSLVAGLLAIEWIVRLRPSLHAALVSGGPAAILARSALAFAIVFSYLAMQEGVVQPFIYFQF